MQVKLNAEQERYIKDKLSEGFESPESVVDAALSLMRHRDAEYSVWLREQVEIGLADLDAGRWVEATPELREDIKRRGRERLARERANSA